MSPVPQSETDLTGNLKSIDVPTLIMQGDDDQIVPYKGAALPQSQAPQECDDEALPCFPHGMLTTHSDVINQDLLALVRGWHELRDDHGQRAVRMCETRALCDEHGDVARRGEP